MLACARGHLGVAEALLDAGAPLEAANHAGVWLLCVYGYFSRAFLSFSYFSGLIMDHDKPEISASSEFDWLVISFTCKCFLECFFLIAIYNH